jgi:hypothetical protein
MHLITLPCMISVDSNYKVESDKDVESDLIQNSLICNKVITSFQCGFLT